MHHIIVGQFNRLVFVCCRFIVPYFYLPEHMLSIGYVEDDSAFVISVIGVSQTIGMITLGYIGDKPWLNVPKTYACCLVGE